MKGIFGGCIFFGLLVTHVCKGEVPYWGKCCLEELLRRFDMEKQYTCDYAKSFEEKCGDANTCLNVCKVYMRKSWRRLSCGLRPKKRITLRLDINAHQEYRIGYVVGRCLKCSFRTQILTLLGVCSVILKEKNSKQNLPEDGSKEMGVTKSLQTETSGEDGEIDELARSSNDECEEDGECEENRFCRKYGINNFPGVCLCKPSFISIGGDCLKTNVTLAQSCIEDIQCSGTDGASLCIDSQCSCDEDFDEHQNMCLPKNQSNDNSSTDNIGIHSASANKTDLTNLWTTIGAGILGCIFGCFVMILVYIFILQRRKSKEESNRLAQGFSNVVYEADKNTEIVKTGIYSEITEDLKIASNSNKNRESTALPTMIKSGIQQDNVYHHLSEIEDEKVYDHSRYMGLTENAAINSYDDPTGVTNQQSTKVVTNEFRNKGSEYEKANFYSRSTTKNPMNIINH